MQDAVYLQLLVNVPNTTDEQCTSQNHELLHEILQMCYQSSKILYSLQVSPEGLGGFPAAVWLPTSACLACMWYFLVDPDTASAISSVLFGGLLDQLAQRVVRYEVLVGHQLPRHR